MNKGMSRKYFPLIATIFVFILVSNLIGYIPLPINTGEKFLLFGIHWPSFQIYAADTNVAFPLILALLVFILFTYEGFRAHGFFGFFKSLLPPGLHGPMAAVIFVDRAAVLLPAADLADRPALGQPARRPHADRVHGRRAGGIDRQHGRVLGAAAARGRDLPVRGGPDRRATGIHLLDPDRDLPR